MKMEYDITEMVKEIAMQAKENQEEFIFETILPYCENILQIKINKEELKQILLNGIQKQQPCEDAISREEVRNIITKDNEMYGYSDRTHDLMEKILELPSVTPSYNSINTELKPCEDCVSREAAIDVVRKWFDKMQLNGDICLDGIISLPSVTPSIPDVENNFNLGYNCGYADAMSDIAESEE